MLNFMSFVCLRMVDIALYANIEFRTIGTSTLLYKVIIGNPIETMLWGLGGH